MCFTGHRSLSIREKSLLRTRLSGTLNLLYEQGARVFLSGGALGYDTLAEQCVLELRQAHPDVRLVIAVPCPSQAARWSPADQRIYRDMLEAADQVLMISDTYFPGCMQKRNRFMVERAAVCLCYLTHCRGGTWNTVSLAYDLGRKIINLGDQDPS